MLYSRMIEKVVVRCDDLSLETYTKINHPPYVAFVWTNDTCGMQFTSIKRDICPVGLRSDLQTIENNACQSDQNENFPDLDNH